MGAYSRSYSFVDGEIPTETEWNVDIDGIIAVLNGQLDDANVDYTSADGIVTMARTQTISGAKTFTAASQFSSTVTVGADDTGYDVKFFGATSGKSLLWDESADKLIVTGDFSVSGTVSDLGSVTTVDINGGTIDGVTIGGASAGAGTFTTLVANTSITGTLATASQPNITALGTIGSLVATTADINAGTVDAVIGGTTPAAGTFTTLAGTTSVVAASDITITSGSILSASGAITFGDENLTTTGTLASGTITVSSDLALATGSITSASGAISFGNENLTTTGTFGAGAGTLTSLSVSDGNITNVGNIALDSISADGSSIAVSNDVFWANNTGVVIGHTAQVSPNGIAPEFQVLGTSAPDSAMTVATFSNDNQAPYFLFLKSRATTIGNNAIVQDGDQCGYLRWAVDDGTDYVSYAAYINVEIDGTPGTDDVPGAIVFGTTADGAASPTERMRIDSAGNVGVGTSTITLGDFFASSGVGLHVHDPSAQNTSSIHLTSGVSGTSNSDGFGLTQSGYDTYLTNWESANSGKLFFATGGANVRMTIDASGNVGIGTADIEAWSSSYSALEFTDSAIMANKTGSSGAGDIHIIDNAYYDGTWKYKADGLASRVAVGESDNIYLYRAVTGTANSAISWLPTITATSAGKVGIGGASNGADLEINNTSNDPFISINGATTGNPYIQFSQNNTQKAYIQYVDSGDVLTFQSDGSYNFTSGNVFISDTANANMTQGLTINQGTNIDEIFTLKNQIAGVQHGMTGITEADTFARMRLYDTGLGGLRVDGLSASVLAININGFQTSSDTTDTSSSQGAINLNGALKSGTSVTSIASGGNVLSVGNNGTQRLVLKGNGDMHITNTTLTALDDEDDIALVRAAQVSMSGGMGIAMDEWDEHLKSTEEDLRRVGVLSSESDFVIQQRMNSLLGGSVVQLYKKMMSHAKLIEENVPQLRGKLIPQIGA